ncbi:MAG: DNA-3-methyladenine glycosylase 2 family protein [Actinobacteria bacterium]|nr:DNA-3-methyladenine glycosylase 2 family protein [Actinomycetota bacterium]
MTRPHEAASEALAAHDPVLARLVDTVGPCTIGRGRPVRTHFAELARMVCYQQLAGAAARTIHGRFEALFAGPPTPAAVLTLPDSALRGAGLSAAKAASIRDLAARVESGEVRLARIGRDADEEVIAQLVTVRGIGRWTAEMFCMFQLRRLDVWPVDDLGVRKGYARIAGLDAMPAAKELGPLGDRFRPYRSVAAWYCWRAVDVIAPG